MTVFGTRRRAGGWAVVNHRTARGIAGVFTQPARPTWGPPDRHPTCPVGSQRDIVGAPCSAGAYAPGQEPAARALRAAGIRRLSS